MVVQQYEVGGPKVSVQTAYGVEVEVGGWLYVSVSQFTTKCLVYRLMLVSLKISCLLTLIVENPFSYFLILKVHISPLLHLFNM